MTTIVYDGQTLATDSRATAGSDIMSDGYVKIMTPGEDETWWCDDHRILALALAGNPSIIKNIIAMLRDNITNMIDAGKYINFQNSRGAAQLILVREDKMCQELFINVKDKQLETLRIGCPLPSEVGGSGEPFARAGLSIGLGAAEAVEVALKNDSASGGEVKTWEHPGVPKKPSVYKPNKDNEEVEEQPTKKKTKK